MSKLIRNLLLACPAVLGIALGSATSHSRSKRFGNWQ